MSTSRFTLFKRDNPCPLCDSTDGRCRENDALILCMTLTDVVDIPGKKFVGLDSSRTWGMWVDDETDWSETRRKQWRTELDHKREQRRQAELERKASALTAVERDRFNLRLLSHFTLHRDDRADLHRRGLSEAQIKAGGFVSVEQWQKLPEDFPITLPGVNLDGRSLIVGSPGYLCPIRDVDGYIVGFQIRLRDPEDDGRYRWLSSNTEKRPNGPKPNLPNGELPLAVFRPSTVTRRAIALVEGTGPKPFKTSEQFGVITIGAAGGQFKGSQETLQATLSTIAGELGTKQIEIYPDAGAVQNPNVMRQYRAVCGLLNLWGYEVQIGWWGQTTKDHPDVDELAVTAQIEWISTAQFESIAYELTGIAPKPAIAQAGADYRAETERIQSELNSIRIQPTLTASGRYIPSGLVKLPKQSGMILIDGPMGCGKTQTVLKELVQQHRRWWLKGFRGLIVPRNALGFQSAHVLELPHHKKHKGFAVPTEVTLCLESGWKLPPDRLPTDAPPLLIFDEPGQTLKQLLNGETSGDMHVFNLNRLRELLQYVKKHGGWVVIAEDGLTNCELDYLTEASGLEVVEFFKFERTNRQAREYLVFDSPSMTWDVIQARLSNGENLVLASDAQKWLRETEEMAIAFGIPPEDIWIIDKDSSELPWVQEFMSDPDRFGQEHKPRILGFSPSVNSGVSINDRAGHFAAMGFHIVHLEHRESKQLIERVRTDIPRFGYVKERGASDDSLFSNCRPELIIRDLYRNANGVEKITDFARYAVEKQPTDRDGNPIDILEAIEQFRASQHDPSTDYGFYLKHWARYRARETYNKLALRDNLIAVWQEQGHKVELMTNTVIKPLVEQRKGIRAELDTKEAIAFAETDSSGLSLSDARDTLRSIGATVEQRRTARKRLLEDKLPNCPLDNPEFVLKTVIKDNGRFLKAAELFWLAQNPEAAKLIDKWGWMNSFTRASKRQEIVWLPKLTFRSAQAKLLHECPLLPFINGQVQQWDNNTPEVRAVHQWAEMRSRQLMRYLRLTIKPMMPTNCPKEDKNKFHNPVQTVNKLLRKLGYEVEQAGWKGGREDRQRQYVITNLNDVDREMVLNALTERFLKRCEDKQEQPLSNPVIKSRIDIIPSTRFDHGSFPDWSDLPFDCRQDFADMWCRAENDEQRGAILQAVGELRRAIA